MLPSIRQLQRLSAHVSVHTDNLDLSYLKTRVTQLSTREQKCVLMIDEVYTSARIEYQNGEFVGLTENGSCAETLLVFMLHSLCSKYKDVVKLIPVSKLTAAEMKTAFDLVMVELHKLSLLVVVVSVDNHIVNR